MRGRTPWQGMLTVARLNWPYYLGAIGALFAAAAGSRLAPMGAQIGSAVIFLGASWFIFGSLGVSHLIYDRSDLYRWGWLKRVVGSDARGRFVLCHSGFDETSASLRARFSDAEWVVLDHYDRERMTERSIIRARQLYPPAPGTLPAVFDRWPAGSASVEIVLGLLAIHELRSEEERIRWFAEAKRTLRPGGRAIVVEHLRDLPNFLAFGPAFLHFHSRAGWRRSWERAGFRLADEFQITRWIRVFVLAAA